MPRINRTAKRASWLAPRKAHQQHNSSNDKFYNSTAWRTVSRGFRSQHPLCRACEEKGLVTEGQCVDHVIPISQGGHRWHWSNLQTLCNSCHARKSGKEAHNNQKT